MPSNGLLRRFHSALAISFCLNIALLAIDFSIDPLRRELSRTERLVVALLGPADALTTRLVPGHGGTQIAAFAVFSFAFYAVMAWVFLSLPVWWRRRA